MTRRTPSPRFRPALDLLENRDTPASLFAASGAVAGGTPLVEVDRPGGPLGDFFAFEDSFRGGVRVAAGDVDGNAANGDELIVGAGPGGGPRVIAFRSDGSVFTDFFALPPDFNGGVNVSVAGGQIVA